MACGMDLRRPTLAPPGLPSPTAVRSLISVTPGSRRFREGPTLPRRRRVDALNNLLLAGARTGKADPTSGTGCRQRPPAGTPRRAWYLLAVRHDPLESKAQQALHRLKPGSDGSSVPGTR
ncbi:MAG: hypothetical protein WKF75_17790 [Singulisphaera sp.]